MPYMSWAVEGAAVAEYRRTGIDGHVNLTTVERLTATQIVLANGNRYRRDNGQLVGDNRTCLLPLTDSTVRDNIAVQALSRVRHAVWELGKDHSGGEAVVMAKLDQIEQLVAQARAVINDPTSA